MTEARGRGGFGREAASHLTRKGAKRFKFAWSTRGSDRWKVMLLERLLLCMASSSRRQVTRASVRSANCREAAFKLFRPEVMCNSDKALVQLWQPVLEATNLSAT